MAKYVSGRLSASYAHTNFKAESNALAAGTVTTTIFGAVTAASTAAVGAKNQNNKLDQLAGSYRLGAVKLTASWASGKSSDTANTTNSVKTKATQIGAEYGFGQIRPFCISGKSKITKESDGSASFDA